MSNVETSSDAASESGQTAAVTERRRSALAFKPFRIYFGGTVLAMNALRLRAVAQGLLMWELTGSPLSLGGVAAATAIPMMMVNLFGGVFADRFEAKFLHTSSCSAVESGRSGSCFRRPESVRLAA